MHFTRLLLAALVPFAAAAAAPGRRQASGGSSVSSPSTFSGFSSTTRGPFSGFSSTRTSTSVPTTISIPTLTTLPTSTVIVQPTTVTIPPTTVVVPPTTTGPASLTTVVIPGSTVTINPTTVPGGGVGGGGGGGGGATPTGVPSGLAAILAAIAAAESDIAAAEAAIAAFVQNPTNIGALETAISDVTDALTTVFNTFGQLARRSIGRRQSDDSNYVPYGAIYPLLCDLQTYLAALINAEGAIASAATNTKRWNFSQTQGSTTTSSVNANVAAIQLLLIAQQKAYEQLAEGLATVVTSETLVLLWTPAWATAYDFSLAVQAFQPTYTTTTTGGQGQGFSGGWPFGGWGWGGNNNNNGNHGWSPFHWGF